MSYQDPTGVTYLSLDAENIEDVDLPILSIFKKNYALDFYNVIYCKTPLGKPFKTVIDICLDHNEAVGINNISRLAQIQQSVLTEPVSHIILSNTTTLQESYSIGHVMNNDPIHINRYPQDIVKLTLSPVSFGKAKTYIFKFKIIQCKVLQDCLIDRKQSIESFYNSLPRADFNFKLFKQRIDTLEELQVSDDDIYMENLILDVKERVYLNDRTITLAQKIANELQDSEKHQQIIYHYKLLSEYKSFLGLGYADPLQDIGKNIIKTPTVKRKLDKYTDAYNKHLITIASAMDFNKVQDYFEEKILELDGLCLDINKKEMQRFISLERGKFQSPSSEYSRLEQLRFIEYTIRRYTQNKPIIVKIQVISKEYLDNATAFTIGMKRKAMRIENALKSMTIEEICNFLDVNQPSHPVLQALASHRLTGKVYLKNDKIDERKAVTKYSLFSKQAKDIADSFDKTSSAEQPKKPNTI